MYDCRTPRKENQAFIGMSLLVFMQNSILVGFYLIHSLPFVFLQNLTTEAKLCIQDCDESTETDFEEEFQSAKNAVGENAYSDLLQMK